jgi:hypothetical protein
MSDSEKQVLDFVNKMETVTLGKWMVNMQNVSSNVSVHAREFPNMCVSLAASELLRRYRENRNDN